MGKSALVLTLFGTLPAWTSSGYGDGYGYGSGYGDVSGSGDGSGDGSGYGYGDGSGYGDRSGDGYWRTVFENAVQSWTAKQRKRLRELSGAFLAFWKSDKDGYPANGGNLPKPVKVGAIHETSGPLSLCHRGTLHATLTPDKWQGERLWVVALVGDVAVSDDKVGALQREVLGEVVMSDQTVQEGR